MLSIWSTAYIWSADSLQKTHVLADVSNTCWVQVHGHTLLLTIWACPFLCSHKIWDSWVKKVLKADVSELYFTSDVFSFLEKENMTFTFQTATLSYAICTIIKAPILWKYVLYTRLSKFRAAFWVRCLFFIIFLFQSDRSYPFTVRLHCGQ